MSRLYKGETIVIKAMPGRYCTECGEAEFLTTADGDRFAAEVQRAMQAIDHGRRTELRSIRRRLGLKQAEAATLFGGGVNAFSEYERGVREMTRVGQVFMPEPEHARTYEQLYRRVYCRMYQRLQPLYRDIQEITRYPKRGLP